MIIFFDGKCNLCDFFVNWIIKKDKKNVFKFASLQSKIGQDFLKQRNLSADYFDSFILYIPNKNYYKSSTAALKVIEKFSFLYFILAKILFLIPVYFRDFVYSYCARNRYKWFGYKENCLIPDKEIRQKFIDL